MRPVLALIAAAMTACVPLALAQSAAQTPTQQNGPYKVLNTARVGARHVQADVAWVFSFAWNFIQKRKAAASIGNGIRANESRRIARIQPLAGIGQDEVSGSCSLGHKLRCAQRAGPGVEVRNGEPIARTSRVCPEQHG